MESIDYRAATFFDTAAQLDNEGQKDLIKYLRETYTEEEVSAIIYGISYFRLLRNKELYKTMRNAIATKLYEEFNK